MPTKKLPPPQRRQLGAKLRQMRERAALMIKDAAPKLDKTRSALQRVESGQTKATVELVRSMMDLYDAYDPTLLNEVREANKTSNPRNQIKPTASS